MGYYPQIRKGGGGTPFTNEFGKKVFALASIELYYIMMFVGYAYGSKSVQTLDWCFGWSLIGVDFLISYTDAHLGEKYLQDNKTYWPAGGGRGQNPKNTAQGNSVQHPIRP